MGMPALTPATSMERGTLGQHGGDALHHVGGEHARGVEAPPSLTTMGVLPDLQNVVETVPAWRPEVFRPR